MRLKQWKLIYCLLSYEVNVSEWKLERDERREKLNCNFTKLVNTLKVTAILC